MKKTFEWKTEKGATITAEIEAGYITKKETLWVDGDTHETEKTVWEAKVISLITNGTVQNSPKFGIQSGKPSIDFAINGKPCAIIIPTDIYNEYTAEHTARINAKANAEAKYQSETKAIYRAMNP